MLDQISHFFQLVFRPSVSCFPVLTPPPFFFNFLRWCTCRKAAHSTEWGSISSQPSSTLTPHPPHQRAATNTVFSSLSSGIFFSFCSIYSIKKYPLRPFPRERGPRRPRGATFGWAASGGTSAPQGLPGPEQARGLWPGGAGGGDCRREAPESGTGDRTGPKFDINMLVSLLRQETFVSLRCHQK